MRQIKELIVVLGLVLTVIVATQSEAFGQLRLNEIESDTPSDIDESCQYVELAGVPGSVIPARTYFLSINGDAGDTGTVNEVVNLGGVTVGANGTVTIIIDPKISGNLCRDLTTTGTRLLLTDNFFGLAGQGGETFLLATTVNPINFTEGEDIDINNDGVIDAAFPLNVVDGLAYVVDLASGRAYGGAPVLFTGDPNVPDAATRFPGNTSLLSKPAWYFGELANSPNNSTVYVSPLSGNFPTGGALTPALPNVPGSAQACTSAKRPADFDGDGKTDFALVRNTGGGASGQITWFMANSATNSYSASVWGLAGDVYVPADYDGDGKSDIAVWRAGPPNAAFFYILQSSTNTLRIDNFGQTGDDPTIVADYDGDGKADPATYRAGAAVGQQSFWFYRQSAPGPTQGQIVYNPWGLNGDTPAPGDFDADGKSDFAVRRNAGGGQSIYYLRQTTAGLASFYWGLQTDAIVPGLYDSDCKSDITVVRSVGAELQWFVRNSTDGSMTVYKWGTPATDILTPGDYDGDGKLDVAIWRPNVNPSQNYFFARDSANGALRALAFGQTGDYPVANSGTH